MDTGIFVAGILVGMGVTLFAEMVVLLVMAWRRIK